MVFANLCGQIEAEKLLKVAQYIFFQEYDLLHDLIKGSVATGGGAFRPGRDYTPPADPHVTDSSSEPDDHVIDPSLREEQSQSSDPPSVRL